MSIRTIILLNVLVIVALSTACPKYRPKFKLDGRMVEAIKAKYSLETAKYDCFSRGYYYDGPSATGIHLCSDGNYGRPVRLNPNGMAEAKQIRDDVIDKTTGAIDELYNEFVIDLQTRRSTTNLLADVTELGLGTAIGITNGERPLQVLGVLLTAFRGGRKSVNLNFYHEQTTPILIARMNALRDLIAKSIEQKKALPVADYRLGSAERDLVAYFYAGTLVNAFAALAEDASSQAKQARADLLRVRDKEIHANVSAELANTQESINAELLLMERDVRSTDAEVTARIGERLKKIYEALNQDEKFKPALEVLRAGTKCQQGINQNEVMDELDAGNPVNESDVYFVVRGANCAIGDDVDLKKAFERIVKKK